MPSDHATRIRFIFAECDGLKKSGRLKAERKTSDPGERIEEPEHFSG